MQINETKNNISAEKTKNKNLSNEIYFVLVMINLVIAILPMIVSIQSRLYVIFVFFFVLFTSLFLTVQQMFQFILFMLPFRIIGQFIRFQNFEYCSWIVYIFLFLLGIKYISDILTQKHRINWTMVLLNIIFLLYGILNLNLENGKLLISHLILILSFYLVFEYKSKFDLKKLTFSLFIGILMSIILSLIISLKYNIGDESYNWTIDGRFQALATNPNSLQLFCVFTISMFMMLYFNSRLSKKSFLCYSGILFATGILTMSKTFFICILFLIIIYFIFSFIKSKQSFVKDLVVSLAILALLCVVFKDKVVQLFERFVDYGGNYNLIDKMTTGRYSLWTQYFALINQSVITILFGLGSTTNFLDIYEGSTPHNDYIAIIYKYGYVGFILLVVLFVNYVLRLINTSKYTKTKIKIEKLYKAIPIFVIMLIQMVEVIIFSPTFRFMIIVAMLCLYNDTGVSKNDVSIFNLFTKRKEIL